MMASSPTLKDSIQKNLILVSGKGGAGKSVVSSALARFLAESGKKTLWMTFEDPFLPPGEKAPIRENLDRLNCVPEIAFEEYIELKIGISILAKLFVKNRLMSYLAKAGPGIHELVLLGKVWHERQNYDHVVVDMPSTGFGLAMYESTRNFSRLFSGGRIRSDAEAMLQTFGSPEEAAHLIVSLPEEMPLREALELDQMMKSIFPDNRCGFILNAAFPDLKHLNTEGPSHEWKNPIASTPTEYVIKRSVLEHENLRIWEEESIPFATLEYAIQSGLPEQVIADLTQQLKHLREVGSL